MFDQSTPGDVQASSTPAPASTDPIRTRKSACLAEGCLENSSAVCRKRYEEAACGLRIPREREQLV